MRVRDEIGRYCPLSWYSGGGIGWGPFSIREIKMAGKFPPPQPSPGVPGEGENRYAGTVTHSENEGGNLYTL